MCTLSFGKKKVYKAEIFCLLCVMILEIFTIFLKSSSLYIDKILIKGKPGKVK